MAKLYIEPRDGKETEFELSSEEVSIGRGVNNTLHFRDPWLSREHALIGSDRGQFYLEDLGSRNGTFLNGEPVKGRRELRPADVVTLGDVRLRFSEDSSTVLHVADSKVSLGGEGTVIISSEELRYDRYKEARRRQDPSADTGDTLLLALSDAASALIAHFPLDELVRKVLGLVLDAVPAERGALLLSSRRDNSELEVVARRGYGDDDEVRISRTIIQVVLEQRQAILTVDAQSDARFDHAVSIMMQGIRSIICVPLTNNDQQVIGLIYLDDRIASDVFTENALRLVGLVSSLATVKIENCYLLEEQIEKRRMEEQLVVGAQIQRGLLPAEPPTIDGYDLGGVNQSCYEIGGDYFDFIAREDGKLAIVVADISGKGVGAALLMAVLQASLRALLQTAVGPAELVSKLNRVLVENSPSNKFATLFYAELDPVGHTLEYVNGGHNPGLWRTNGGIEELGSSGPIVGLVPKAVFRSHCLRLAAGDTLLLYTDGVTELMDDDEEEYGTERLAEILRQQGSVNSAGLIDQIHDSLLSFGASESFDDDSTLVVVHRRGSS